MARRNIVSPPSSSVQWRRTSDASRRPLTGPPRAACRAIASRTRPATSAVPSGRSPRRTSAVGRCRRTPMSMRSSSGPDTRRRYAWRRSAVHVHPAAPPQGHGFIAAIDGRPARIGDGADGAGDHEHAVLHRPAQRLQGVATELGQLVEEQHAVVGEAQLARAHVRAASDQRGGRRRVVRRAERPPGHEPAAGRQDAGHRLQPRDLERLVLDQRRQDAGQARAPASTCPRRAGRPSAGCGRRRPRSRAPAARAAGRARRPGRGWRSRRAAAAARASAAPRRCAGRRRRAPARGRGSVRPRRPAPPRRTTRARRGAPPARCGALPRRPRGRPPPGARCRRGRARRTPPPHAAPHAAGRRRRRGWRARSPGRSRCRSCAPSPAPG